MVLKISNDVSLCGMVPLPSGSLTTYEGWQRSIRDPTSFVGAAAIPTRPIGPRVRSHSVRYKTACSLGYKSILKVVGTLVWLKKGIVHGTYVHSFVLYLVPFCVVGERVASSGMMAFCNW